MAISRNADRIVRAALRAGFTVSDRDRAETGSVYIHLVLLNDTRSEILIRVSDHACAFFGRRDHTHSAPDYSADDFDGSVNGAMAFIERFASEHADPELAEMLQARRLWRRWNRRAYRAGQCRRHAIDDTAAQAAADAARKAAEFVRLREELPADWNC